MIHPHMLMFFARILTPVPSVLCHDRFRLPGTVHPSPCHIDVAADLYKMLAIQRLRERVEKA